MTIDTSEYESFTLSIIDNLISKFQGEYNAVANLFTRFGIEVYRQKNGQVIDRFTTPDAAARYIDINDYDPNKVLIRQKDTNADADGKLRTVESLRAFRKECLNDCPRFSDGVPVYRKDIIDGPFVKLRAPGKFPGIDFKRLPFDQINWTGVAEDTRNNCIQRGSYANLNGQRYYGIEGLI